MSIEPKEILDKISDRIIQFACSENVFNLTLKDLYMTFSLKELTIYADECIRLADQETLNIINPIIENKMKIIVKKSTPEIISEGLKEISEGMQREWE